MTAGKRGSGAAGQGTPSLPNGHSIGRARVRLGLVTLMIGLGAVWGWDHLQSQQTLATIPVREVTAESIAHRVHKARGQVLILSLYRPDSEDPYVVGDLRRWTAQTTHPRVELIALAVGTRREARLLFRDGEDRGVQRLPPDWLSPQQLELLENSMGELGLRHSGNSNLPITAVFDRNGRVTEQWHGTLDYLPVLAAAKAARQR
jgi:hypothetical protein